MVDYNKIIGKENSGVIIPGKDYDNIMTYLGYIKEARNFIYLIDRYFNHNSLDLLRKGLKENNSIEEIKIISGHDYMDNDFKDMFKKFTKQMKSDNKIKVEFRVLINKQDLFLIHDRYLLTKNKSYNFISSDTAARGQLSHITEVDDMANLFNELWKRGRDVKRDWLEIEKFLVN